MKQLHFGTAGIPLSTQPRNTTEGIKWLKQLGLSAMELEFVRSVNIKEEQAPAIKSLAAQEGIILTSHGQYYINLNAIEKGKREASIKRTLNAARIAALFGAWSVCFHAAFYMGKPKEVAYNRVKEAFLKVRKALQEDGLEIWLRPEIGGKQVQFGGLEELLALSAELEGVQPCVDYAHLHARDGGRNNSYTEFAHSLERIEAVLGKEALKTMHIHCEGITYGPKGEKSHVNLEESDLNYPELVRAWKDFAVQGVVISESPNIEKDALLLQKTYQTK